MAEAPVVQTLMNEAALKRFDPYVQQVLDVGKYVAIYSFEDNAWKKTEVEGSLFVYSRSADPLYNIFVLNRLNKNNLVEPITSQVDLQINSPFLLYRNFKGNIFGIWFYDKAECVRLSHLIKKLVETLVGSNSKPVESSSNGGPNVDIFKMLTKAQEAYESSKDVAQNVHKTSSKEVDTTSKSVAEFFAKAVGAPQTAGESTGLQRHPTLSESEKNPGLLQQLMSNPVHSVEHIEKQQRSITPQSSEQGSDALKQLIRPHSTTARSDIFSSCSGEALSGVVKCENGINYLNTSATSFPPSIKESKPDLMPPAMFTLRAPLQTQTVPEPLTRNQLLHALDYLLHNDADFMAKVHDAYIKSLTQKIM